MLIRVARSSTILVPAVLLMGMSPEQHPGTTQLDQPIARIQAGLGKGFRLHQTDHFVILYDTPYETLRPLTARLEGIYDAIERFCAPFDFTKKKLDSRLTILLFSRYEQFSRYAESADLPASGIAGFYDPKTNVAIFVDVLDTPPLSPLQAEVNRLQAMLQSKSEPVATPVLRMQIENRLLALRAERESLAETFNRLVIQHEAAHQVFFNLGVHVRGSSLPLWLAEGLACQFEVPQSDLQGSLKRVNQLRLGDFREALGAAASASQAADLWQKSVEQGRFLTLHELAVAEHFDGEQGRVAARYAQSWAMVYYLQQQKPHQFAKYLAILASRGGGEYIPPQRELNEFEAVFGPLNEDFTEAWLRYILRLRYDPTARKG